MAAPAAAAAAAAAAPGSKGEAKISPAKGENLNETTKRQKEKQVLHVERVFWSTNFKGNNKCSFS